jgi:hypothetical protein
MNSLLFHSRLSTLLSMGSIFTCVIAIKSCQRYPPVFLLYLIIAIMTHANYNIAGDVNHNLTQKRSDTLDTIAEHDKEYAISDDDVEKPVYSESDEFAYDDGFEDDNNDAFLDDDDWLKHSTYVNYNDQGAISSAPSSCHTKDLSVMSQTTIVTHTQKHIKPPNRFRNFTNKAKDHLRDEENRRKAVQYVRTGVREVAEFVAEVQAKGGQAGGDGGALKTKGKELAKVCVKFAMKRLVK